jgi:hypothetical protein
MIIEEMQFLNNIFSEKAKMSQEPSSKISVNKPVAELCHKKLAKKERELETSKQVLVEKEAKISDLAKQLEIQTATLRQEIETLVGMLLYNRIYSS